MKIWVDGDACPKPVKEILYRLAERVQVVVTFVANQGLRIPNSPFVRLIQVGQGSDVADDEIANKCGAGDLIITADIPLAARIVEKGAQALDPRGTLYDKNNIRQILSMRNFMENLRESGEKTDGPCEFGKKERMKFGNALDKYIATR